MKQKALTTIAQFRLLSDEELVYRYAHRNEETAMHILYERYSHLVMGLCLKYLNDVESAGEVTRQIFIRLLNDLARFEIKSFKPWLVQLCRNHCQIQLRKMGRSVDSELLAEHPMPDLSLPVGVSEEQLTDRLQNALQQLPEQQQQCIRMFYEDRQPYAQIAKSIGLSVAQVRQLIQEGRTQLRHQLYQPSNANQL